MKASLSVLFVWQWRSKWGPTGTTAGGTIHWALIRTALTVFNPHTPTYAMYADTKWCFKTFPFWVIAYQSFETLLCGQFVTAPYNTLHHQNISHQFWTSSTRLLFRYYKSRSVNFDHFAHLGSASFSSLEQTNIQTNVNVILLQFCFSTKPQLSVSSQDPVGTGLPL